MNGSNTLLPVDHLSHGSAQAIIGSVSIGLTTVLLLLLGLGRGLVGRRNVGVTMLETLFSAAAAAAGAGLLIAQLLTRWVGGT